MSAAEDKNVIPAAELPGCLHLLMSCETSVFEACRAYCQPEDHIVLVDGGVLHLLAEHHPVFSGFVLEPGKGSKSQVSALAADALARGISGDLLPEGVALIGDAEWAALVLAHKHCLSWK